MKLSLYMDDRETEKIFSYLRWIFLLVGIMVFYFPPLADRLNFTKETFPLLLAIGFVYMAVTQVALIKMPAGNEYFNLLTKAGIVFDYIALMWLLALTNGVLSPLFPIAYLVVMHATIYWRTKGAILSSISLTAGYSTIFALQAQFDFNTTFVFILNLIFIWIIGVFGSLIVIRERKHLRQKEIFHELMFTDYLTGLYNHRHFQEQLRIMTSVQQNFLLVMGDIDHFKQINDHFGHLTGDEILKNLGGIFRDLADDYDAQAFRYGGEEFAFLLPDTEENRQICFFDDLYGKLSSEKFSKECISVTMSFGIAASKAGVLPDKLLGYTDQLLYRAKANGKNQVKFESGYTYYYSKAKEEIAASKQ
ncbi:GGDEF domain-containing protein [Bacillus sp. ISL-55]|uniref:GGDEF domain-containing protein n=1 Tax=Bacillus sp. ISL-55 TaxID=2819134 RepID=UPI001BEAE41E|nr:GGDEF domain-containing protein [Bacillus sp. ISL-55]MBT2691512.1 GGDEF domain-containing protein [Bacillus sp. ISL-55]